MGPTGAGRRQVVIDALAVAGLALVASGLWLVWGPGAALLGSGALFLAAAIAGSVRR